MKRLLFLCFVGWCVSVTIGWCEQPCVTQRNFLSVSDKAVQILQSGIARKDSAYTTAVSGLLEGYHTGNLVFNRTFAEFQLDHAAVVFCQTITSTLPSEDKKRALSALDALRQFRQTHPRPEMPLQSLQNKMAEIDRSCYARVDQWKHRLPAAAPMAVPPADIDRCLTSAELKAVISAQSEPVERERFQRASEAAYILTNVLSAEEEKLDVAIRQADQFLDTLIVRLTRWLKKDLPLSQKRFILGRLETAERLRADYPRLVQPSASLQTEIENCFIQARELRSQLHK